MKSTTTPNAQHGVAAFPVAEWVANIREGSVCKENTSTGSCSLHRVGQSTTQNGARTMYDDDRTARTLEHGPDPYCVDELKSLCTINADRCGHGVPMEIDCEQCDYENMLADSDR